MSEPVLDSQTRMKSPAPGLTVSQPSLTHPTESEQQSTDTERRTAETMDAAETQSDQNAVSKKQLEVENEERREQERKQGTLEAAAEEQVVEMNVPEMENVGPPHERTDVALEEQQVTEKDIDSVLLSEKERQNEEVNEKDNCSASSISSTSSTLEREEREEKFNNDIEAGTVGLNFTH